MKAVVVGAGPSGLAALKELRELGIDARCYESAADLGGVFRFDPTSGGVWSGCRLTSSATTTAYSDFPPEDDSPHQMLHDEYWRYLDQYAAAFDLRERIVFRRRITGAERRDGGGWRLTIADDEQRVETVEADVVAWCAGLHQNPSFPEAVSNFDGPVSHSCDFKTAEVYAGQRVLIIGAGESGADIVKMVADVADRCVLSLRRGVAVLPRMRNGLPTDYFTTRLFYSLPRWMARSVNPRGKVLAWRAFTALISAPVFALMTLVAVLVEGASKLGQRGAGVPVPVIRRIVELMRASGGSVGDQFLTKSEAFVHALVNGSCELRGGVVGFSGREAIFADGARESFDHVLCCTGFSPRISIFPQVEAGRLYRGIFSPDLGASVGFIGFVRPAIGAIPPIAEMQARYFAQVASGRLALPDPAAMAKTVERDVAKQQAMFGLNTDRMPYLVDYTSYMDDMAALMGCKPRQGDLRGDLALLYKFYCAHFMPAQYRLIGPGAKTDLAKRQIKKQIVAYPPAYLPFMLFYLLLAKALNKLGLRAFKPHLAV